MMVAGKIRVFRISLLCLGNQYITGLVLYDPQGVDMRGWLLLIKQWHSEWPELYGGGGGMGDVIAKHLWYDAKSVERCYINETAKWLHVYWMDASQICTHCHLTTFNYHQTISSFVLFASFSLRYVYRLVMISTICPRQLKKSALDIWDKIQSKTKSENFFLTKFFFW